MKPIVTKNQYGFTLIEVLLSIILLSIILTSFFSFFTQSAIFSQKNSQKLDTIQTCQKVINLIDMNFSRKTLENDEVIDAAGNVNNAPYTLNKQEIENYIHESIPEKFNVSAILKNSTSQNLIQVNLTIEDQNTGEKSETYTYVRK